MATSVVVVLPIILPNIIEGSKDDHIQNCSKECMAFFICSPCLIAAAPFILIWKVFSNLKKRKQTDIIIEVNKKDNLIISDTDSLKEQRRKQAKMNAIIRKCEYQIGSEFWNLLENGSHNEKVISYLQTQPYWVLKNIFEDLNPYFNNKCGKERMELLKSQVYF